MTVAIEDAVRVVREAMAREPWDSNYDVIEARLVEIEGRLSWGVIVGIPGGGADSTFSVATIDRSTGEIEWLPGIN